LLGAPEETAAACAEAPIIKREVSDEFSRCVDIDVQYAKHRQDDKTSTINHLSKRKQIYPSQIFWILRIPTHLRSLKKTTAVWGAPGEETC